jgi:hypothetical protein
MVDTFWNWLIGGVAWELAARLFIFSGLADGLVWLIATVTFGWKPTRAQFWAFFLGFPVLLFLVLFALAAANTRQTPIVVQAPPVVAPKPDLQAFVTREGGGTMSAVKGGPAFPFISADIAISNVGTMPSIVGGYWLTAAIGGVNYPGTLLYGAQVYKNLEKGVHPSTGNSTKTVEDPATKPLFEKTADPIVPGNQIIGRIAYSFPQLGPNYLQPGTNLTLHYYDVLRHEHHLTWPIQAGSPNTDTFVPGMDNLP